MAYTSLDFTNSSFYWVGAGACFVAVGVVALLPVQLCIIAGARKFMAPEPCSPGPALHAAYANRTKQTAERQQLVDQLGERCMCKCELYCYTGSSLVLCAVGGLSDTSSCDGAHSWTRASWRSGSA